MNKQGSDVLLLIDQSLETDRRASEMLALIKERGSHVDIADIRVPLRDEGFALRVRALLLSGLDFLALLVHGLARWATYRRFWRQKQISRYRMRLWGPDVVTEIRRMMVALRFGRSLAQRGQTPQLIIANDLYCALAASAIVRHGAMQWFWYDIHEFSPFRQRRTNCEGRAALALMAEGFALSHASRSSHVSEGLCATYHELYGVVRPDYVSNAYYARHAMLHPMPEADEPVHILYFGAFGDGRGLDRLSRLLKENPALEATFFIPPRFEVPESFLSLASSRVSFVREADYSETLRRMLDRKRRFLGWCVIEDLCLSYAMAEPSKWHQCLSVNLPTIVQTGQYLAQIVEREGGGIIIDCDAEDSPEWPDAAGYAVMCARVQNIVKGRRARWDFDRIIPK